MIPQGSTLANSRSVTIQQQPSRTYRLDGTGTVDGLEAVKQAAFKILQTERFRYLVYSANYGGEMQGMNGKDRMFVRSELARRIREALMQDDRIRDVSDFLINFNGDSVLAKFTVISQFGSFEMEREVI